MAARPLSDETLHLIDALRTALFETIARWRQRAESPMTSRDVAEAAAVLVRSCEGMLATMTAVPA